MKLPATILVTDIGSTTTKALLLRLDGDCYSLMGSAQAPTTVEAPTENVTEGVLEAARRLGEQVGKKLVDNGKLSTGKEFDAFYSTSSAGGGLQILVSGLAQSVTAKSAYRAACAAGGVILDVLAVDDGRMPHEKVEAIEDLRPDMILIAGGIDGGDVVNVVRMTAVLMEAKLKPKYLSEGKMPIVFAGNIDVRRSMEVLLGGKSELMCVDNLRPEMDRENLGPTRRAIHELFTKYVMARAPGYPAVVEWTSLPIEPTPAAVERMIEVVSAHKGGNTIMVDIGGATTDVFSYYGRTYSRTVSANLGMSYSASHVLLEAGARNIMRWLTSDVSEREARNMIANKAVYPTRLPENDVELEVEQAVAREALRLALKMHRELSVRVHPASLMSKMKDLYFHEREFAEDEYIEMDKVLLLFGSGGVLSHAPERWQAAQMMVDGFEPEGVTELALDSIFMTPHLGTVARLSEDAAARTFYRQCYVPLGTCIAFSGKIQLDRPVAEVVVRRGDKKTVLAFKGGDMEVVPGGHNEIFEVEIIPARKIDAGAGPGMPVKLQCSGGEVGIIIDARGRPIIFAGDENERREDVTAWRSAFLEATR